MNRVSLIRNGFSSNSRTDFALASSPLSPCANCVERKTHLAVHN